MLLCYMMLFEMYYISYDFFLWHTIFLYHNYLSLLIWNMKHSTFLAGSFQFKILGSGNCNSCNSCLTADNLDKLLVNLALRNNHLLTLFHLGILIDIMEKIMKGIIVIIVISKLFIQINYYVFFCLSTVWKYFCSKHSFTSCLPAWF